MSLLDQPLPLALPDPALSLAAPKGLTASQSQAFARVCAGRLTLVWGPPGTGKTHFLSVTIAALAAQGLRVAVTAFTHSAVEHLLAKLAGDQPELRVCKLGELKKPTLAVRSVAPGDARYQPAGAVLGGTVYGLERALKAGMSPADVLVVDDLDLGATLSEQHELWAGLLALSGDGCTVIASTTERAAIPASALIVDLNPEN